MLAAWYLSTWWQPTKKCSCTHKFRMNVKTCFFPRFVWNTERKLCEPNFLQKKKCVHTLFTGWKNKNYGPIHTGRTRRKASKWNLLLWMRASTLDASNIKGFAFEFACSRPVWIGPTSLDRWLHKITHDSLGSQSWLGGKGKLQCLMQFQKCSVCVQRQNARKLFLHTKTQLSISFWQDTCAIESATKRRSPLPSLNENMPTA